jgi:hypothetical protein
MLKKKVAAFFFLNKLNAAKPNFYPRIFHTSKKWIFSSRVFCADSEYMLDVAYKPFLAEKSPKNLFFGKIPKKRKNPTQKKISFFFS